MAERNAEDIQREIEQSRAALADAVDQLANRTSPKRVADNVKQTLRERAATTQGKIAIGVAGGVLAFLIIRRVRKH